MAKGLGFALAIVALIVGFLFRSWKIAFISIIPNIIPLLWVCGLMFVFGIELKLTTAIIFTVAFGIAVDDTIHFMAKLKMELEKKKSWLYAVKRAYLETGKAIILTTIVLVSGFSILTLSQFGVTFYSGLLIGMALVFALISDFILLPVLLIFLIKPGK
jgi:predicted RND superfamily exporter protein